MKTLLRRGGASALCREVMGNLPLSGFTSCSDKGLLGFATFPSTYDQNPLHDGVVFLYSAVQNGDTDNYNEGKVGRRSRMLTGPI